jgi:UDP-perosamine 4-acetyltransferase
MPPTSSMKTVIVGAGQNGVQVFNILKHDAAVDVIGFLDDSPAKVGATVCGRPVLGSVASAEELFRTGRVAAAMVAIGNNAIRGETTRRLEALGIPIVKAIHPHTCIDDTATLGPGTIVEMGVMIHPEARIGAGVFLGGSSVVAHHCVIGDFSLVGGGVIFGGNVAVGDHTTLGVGTVLQPQIKIGRNVTTGVGSAVIKDLPDHAVAVGVPAKVIRLATPAG